VHARRAGRVRGDKRLPYFMLHHPATLFHLGVSIMKSSILVATLFVSVAAVGCAVPATEATSSDAIVAPKKEKKTQSFADVVLAELNAHSLDSNDSKFDEIVGKGLDELKPNAKAKFEKLQNEANPRAFKFESGAHTAYLVASGGNDDDYLGFGYVYDEKDELILDGNAGTSDAISDIIWHKVR
jgi:hypothetical protein